MSETPTPRTTSVQEDFVFLAEEFAKLLVASDIDDETQLAVLDALPHMTLEEIVDLIGLLEAKYVVGETIQLDEELRKKFQNISHTFIQNEAQIDNETVQKLELLAEKIE